MTTLQKSAQNQLRQYVEQIERLEEEKRALAEDVKEKYAEAKANGFDTKAMRKIVQLRKKSETERNEEQSILDLYMHALGMAGTPLDDWANGQDNAEEPAAAEATISVNGGPDVPISDVKAALGKVKAAKPPTPKGRMRGARVTLPETEAAEA